MILQKLKEDMTASLKSGDAFSLSVLRMMISAVNYEKIDKQHELSDDEVINVLTREVKKRRDSIVLYRQGKREELAKKEEKEIALIGRYLPLQMSGEEIKKEVMAIISSISEADRLNFGKVMGTVMAKLKGKADGALITKTVKETLGL